MSIKRVLPVQTTGNWFLQTPILQSCLISVLQLNMSSLWASLQSLTSQVEWQKGRLKVLYLVVFACGCLESNVFVLGSQPAAPTNINVDPKDTSATLRWGVSCDNGAGVIEFCFRLSSRFLCSSETRCCCSNIIHALSILVILQVHFVVPVAISLLRTQLTLPINMHIS